MYSHRITVFTPTYNRAYILEELYTSLKKQKFLDFEWLIVDDGSTDNTELLVQKWKKESNFEIRYFKTSNGGKHRAINYGLSLANGELFFTMDSDDTLTEDALFKIDNWFKALNAAEGFCGISANKGYSAANTTNHLFNDSHLDKTWLETYLYEEKGALVLRGERAIVFYTDFHKKYRYPEFDGENFMTEAVVYNRMAHDGYKMRFFNDIIWIFEYRDDGLTKAGNTLFLNNPRGYGLWLREKAEFENRSSVYKLRMFYTFSCDLKDKYDAKIIAECIGTKPVVIKCMLALHKAVRFIKRK